MRRPSAIVLLTAFGVALSGCTAFSHNARLVQFNPAVGYRFTNLPADAENTDGLFVVVAFSGGGTRAAALAYGVLEELRDTPIQWHGRTRRLLDEVDIITSVSGGSFTAAYYGLHGDGLFDGTFQRVFLKQNLESEMSWSLLSPVNLWKLAGRSYGRSDLAAEYYDRHIFGGATYADLAAARRRPWVMLNGADMSIGATFPFIQDQFDLICSDLSQLPVARAVAASSAFPGLLTPLTFENYAGTCGYREPSWLQEAQGGRRENAERAVRADDQRSYYAGDAARRRPYVHLVDGGVTDNIGLREVLYSLASTDPNWSILGLIDQRKIEKLVVIVVNAAVQPENNRDRSAAVPGLVDTLLNAASTPLDKYSFDTVELLDAQRDKLVEGPKIRASCAAILEQSCPGARLPGGELQSVDAYVPQVAFDFLTDESERHYFNNLPTSFELPPDAVDKLTAVGRRLLREDPQFQELIAALH